MCGWISRGCGVCMWVCYYGENKDKFSILLHVKSIEYENNVYKIEMCVCVCGCGVRVGVTAVVRPNAQLHIGRATSTASKSNFRPPPPPRPQNGDRVTSKPLGRVVGRACLCVFSVRIHCVITNTSLGTFSLSSKLVETFASLPYEWSGWQFCAGWSAGRTVSVRRLRLEWE